jgi:membrane protease YdiL (CAAX protease family)
MTGSVRGGRKTPVNQAAINDMPVATDPNNRRRLLLNVFVLAGVMILIAICEFIFAYRNVAYGIVLSLALCVLLYLLLAVPSHENRLTLSLESIALVPIYILFTSSLPWFFINQRYLLPAVYSCIIALCFLHIYQKNLSIKELFGLFPRGANLFYCIIGATVIGVATGVVEYLILKPAAAYPHFSIGDLFLNLFYMILFVGVGEELLFRGLIQRDLVNLLGTRWGLVGASLLFAIMHLTWRSVPELFFVFVAGLIFGGLYLKTKGLYTSILMHGINNVVLMAVYPYLLKGVFFKF